MKVSNQDLIQEHVKEKCRYCDIHDCNGIHVTINKQTRCEKDYADRKMFNK